MSFGRRRLWYLALLLNSCSLFDFTSPTPSNPAPLGVGGTEAGEPNAGGSSSAGSAAIGASSNGGEAEGGSGEPSATAGSAGGGAVSSGGTGGVSAAGNGGSSAGHGGSPTGVDCAHSGFFPATAMLDDFERAGPFLNEDWKFENGDAPQAVLSLSKGFVTIENASVGNVAQWANPVGGFGSAQEVWATVSNINPDGGGVALWLKEKVLGVGYYSDGQTLFIYYRGGSFETISQRQDMNLASRPRVRLGGRAFADGCVQMFVDDELVLHGFVTDLASPPAPTAYNQGGRIGIAAEGPVHFEDFGGGSL